jgi:hypothetical protein
MSHSLNLQFRPNTYFWAKELGISLLSDIKGANRRSIAQHALQDDQSGDIPPELLAHALKEDERRFIGRLHPSFLGGEYLPSTRKQEVEIARITIASTTQDVTCVYARPLGKRISYRIVDEYNGDTITGRQTRTSTKPLSLAELVAFFLQGWDLLGCLDHNFCEYGYPRDEVHGFIVDASSSFYSEFEAAITHEIDAWLNTVQAAQTQTEPED